LEESGKRGRIKARKASPGNNVGPSAKKDGIVIFQRSLGSRWTKTALSPAGGGNGDMTGKAPKQLDGPDQKAGNWKLPSSLGEQGNRKAEIHPRAGEDKP